jgi:hypothetical protein
LLEDDSEDKYFWGIFFFPHREVKYEAVKLVSSEPFPENEISEDPYEYKREKVRTKNGSTEGRAVIEFTIKENGLIRQLIENDDNYDVELFFKIRYQEDEEPLPVSYGDYLKVGYNIDDNIVIKPAVSGYNFPEIFTCSGNRILIFVENHPQQAGENPGMNLGEIGIAIGQEIAGAIDVQKLYDKTYRIAVRELEQGKLVTSEMEIIRSKRMYKDPIVQYARDGIEFRVKRAVNFGFKNAYVHEGKLVTTKGINQIEYFASAGIKNKLLRFSAKFLECGVLDLSFLVHDAAEGKISTFPPIDMIVDQTIADMDEDLEEQFRVDKENAKRKGAEAMQSFVKNDYRAEKHNYKDSKFVSNETLKAILSGQLKNFMKTENYDFEQKHPERPKNNYLLIQKTIHPVENKGIYIIESIFISDDFINE